MYVCVCVCVCVCECENTDKIVRSHNLYLFRAWKIQKIIRLTRSNFIIYYRLCNSNRISNKQIKQTTPFSKVSLYELIISEPIRYSSLLCNLKVHYSVHKCLSPNPVLCFMNPVHSLTPYFSKLHYIILTCTSILLCGHFLSGFPSKILHAFLISLYHCRMNNNSI